MFFTRSAAIAAVLSFVLLVVGVAAQPPQPPDTRLRVAHYVLDAPEIDVYVDGERLVDALSFLKASPHLDIASGEHELVIVPTGQPLEDALLEPLALTLEKGNDYTVALIGQVADESWRAQLINESALVAGARDLENPASYAILLHGISDGPTVDFTMDGEKRIAGLSFGEYEVVAVSLAPHDILVTFSDDPDQILFQNSAETPPSNDLLLFTVMVGAYPDQLDVSGAVSRLPDRTILDFLASFTETDEAQFTVLLAAIEAAGLTETLAQEGIFTLFAPTDAAFAQLPQGALEALLADPEALEALLRYHVVPDIFTTRDLEAPITFVTLADAELTVAPEEGGFVVNNSAQILFGGFPVVMNGNVIAVDAVLFPPAD